MKTSAYTLLIVESPTIAAIVQNLSPSSVYVLPTHGFCWRPGYDAEKNQLKAIADPDKRDIRKELKEQSAAASQIIIAADADPSGDFISWSLNRFINRPDVRIGRMKSLDRNGILNMLEQAEPLEPLHLEMRLKNRFLIRKEWPKHAAVPDLQLAGLTAVFGTDNLYHHFLDENDRLFRSTKPFHCPSDEWITIRNYADDDVYKTEKPLSTFDLVERIVKDGAADRFMDAQSSLNRLFQTVLPSSGKALISYPRTSARAFYSDTWEHLQHQYLQYGGLSDLKPAYLRDIADTNIPHESVHPISISLNPETVRGEIPEETARLYEKIYIQTIKAIRIPERLPNAFVSELSPDIYYFSEEPGTIPSISSLRPCFLLSDLGHLLNDLRTVKASRFGRDVDQWIDKEWIRVQNGVVSPGKEVLAGLKYAKALKQKLERLSKLMDEEELQPETVRAVISS